MKMMILIVAGLGWAAPLSAQAATSSGAETEILAVVNAIFEGMRRADSAMVRPLFHAKARMIAVDLREPVRPPSVQESVDGFIRMIGRPRADILDEQLSNIKTLVDGPLASVWADYKLFLGKTLNHCGVDHFLLVKEGGVWKIIELADTRRAC